MKPLSVLSTLVNTVAYILFKPLEKFFFKKDNCRFEYFGETCKVLGRVRGILIEYFNYPPPSVPQSAVWKFCSACPREAHLWCVECEKRFCGSCAARAHHPGTFNELHSVEEISQPQGVLILTPILDELFILCLVLRYFPEVAGEVDKRYFTRQETCPMVGTLREVMSIIDGKLMFYIKDFLVASCGTEDSYHKLFLDAWVRNIVTQSDDFILLIMTCIHAYFFDRIVAIAIVPFFAGFYTFAYEIVARVERHIPKNETTKMIEDFVHFINLFAGKADIPPTTGWRIRPDKDRLDFLSYCKNRALKYVRLQYKRSKDNIRYFLQECMTGIVLFRGLNIFLSHKIGVGPGDLVAWILSHIGFHGMISRQQKMLGSRAYGLVDNHVVFGGTESVLGAVSDMLTLNSVLLLMLPATTLVALVLYVSDERDKFMQWWNAGGKEAYIGNCCCTVDAECPCSSRNFWRSSELLTDHFKIE